MALAKDCMAGKQDLEKPKNAQQLTGLDRIPNGDRRETTYREMTVCLLRMDPPSFRRDKR
jgi:hypothetical protein